MANPLPASFLNFPIVDPKTGQATVDFTRWLNQLMGQIANLSLDGNLNAGMGKQVDPATLAKQIANLDSNGIVLPGGIDLSRSYINKYLDYINDGTNYAKTLASYVKGGVPYTFKGAWTSTASYNPGDEVTSGGNYYLCVTANSNSQPPNANWQLLGPVTVDNVADGTNYVRLASSHASGNVAYNYKGVWSSTASYVVGDEVVYGRSYWLAQSANTNSAPGTGNANWQVVGSYSDFQGAWSSTVSYVPGDEVTYSGNYWVCVTANTNSAPTLSNANWQVAGPVNLDSVADGTTYLRMPGSNMDSNRRALIDFSQSGHVNKILDNIGDGTTYIRMPGSNMDSNRRALIDFAQSAHINKVSYNIPMFASYNQVENATVINAGGGTVYGLGPCSTAYGAGGKANCWVYNPSTWANTSFVVDTGEAANGNIRAAQFSSWWPGDTRYLAASGSIDGSNDNTNWTLNIASWSNATTDPVYIPLNNSGAFRYYRFNVTAPLGGDSANPNEVNVSNFIVWNIGTHSKKHLDQDVIDGTTYLRMPGSNMDSNRRALIDFSQSGHVNKILDNIADGPSYKRLSVTTSLENMLQDPGFENTAVGATPSSWTTGTVTTPGQSGAASDHALETPSLSGYGGMRSVQFGCQPGETYIFQGYIKSVNGTGIWNSYFESWKTDHSTQINNTAVQIPGVSTTSWVAFTQIYTIPAGAYYFNVSIVNASSTADQALIDNVSLRKVRSLDNEVADGTTYRRLQGVAPDNVGLTLGYSNGPQLNITPNGLFAISTGGKQIKRTVHTEPLSTANGGNTYPSGQTIYFYSSSGTPYLLADNGAALPTFDKAPFVSMQANNMSTPPLQLYATNVTTTSFTLNAYSSGTTKTQTGSITTSGTQVNLTADTNFAYTSIQVTGIVPTIKSLGNYGVPNYTGTVTFNYNIGGQTGSFNVGWASTGSTYSGSASVNMPANTTSTYIIMSWSPTSANGMGSPSSNYTATEMSSQTPVSNVDFTALIAEPWG